MSVFVQYGKVGKPIVYNTLPTASEDLKGVCGQVEDKIYICDGSNWNVFSNTTLKKLLDITKSTYCLFDHYQGASVDDLIAYDDTENVTNFAATFQSCFKLIKAPLLNMSKANSCNAMFNQCNALTYIPLYDTSAITNMNYFLEGCIMLENIPLFNTSNVKKMEYMFRDCKKLSTIPHFDTSNVTTMTAIFYGCSSLTTVPALDVSNVVYFGDCFFDCSSLKSILMTGMKANFNISVSTKFEQSDLVTILNNLATVTTTKTLTMGATNLAKLTDEEKAIATNKGWTLA
mgnify:CR=1 FL=1